MARRTRSIHSEWIKGKGAADGLNMVYSIPTTYTVGSRPGTAAAGVLRERRADEPAVSVIDQQDDDVHQRILVDVYGLCSGGGFSQPSIRLTRKHCYYINHAGTQTELHQRK